VKNLAVVLIALSPLSTYATDNGPLLTNTANDPYQVLKNAFNSAAPAEINDFPTLAEMDSKTSSMSCFQVLGSQDKNSSFVSTTSADSSDASNSGTVLIGRTEGELPINQFDYMVGSRLSPILHADPTVSVDMYGRPSPYTRWLVGSGYTGKPLGLTLNPVNLILNGEFSSRVNAGQLITSIDTASGELQTLGTIAQEGAAPSPSTAWQDDEQATSRPLQDYFNYYQGTEPPTQSGKISLVDTYRKKDGLLFVHETRSGNCDLPSGCPDGPTYVGDDYAYCYPKTNPKVNACDSDAVKNPEFKATLENIKGCCDSPETVKACTELLSGCDNSGTPFASNVGSAANIKSVELSEGKVPSGKVLNIKVKDLNHTPPANGMMPLKEWLQIYYGLSNSTVTLEVIGALNTDRSCHLKFIPLERCSAIGCMLVTGTPANLPL
jgi:hypothetical protein